jgi:hypothetical protein
MGPSRSLSLWWKRKARGERKLASSAVSRLARDRSLIQWRIEPRRILRGWARMEQRAIGGVGRDCSQRCDLQHPSRVNRLVVVQRPEIAIGTNRERAIQSNIIRRVARRSAFGPRVDLHRFHLALNASKRQHAWGYSTRSRRLKRYNLSFDRFNEAAHDFQLEYSVTLFFR